MYLDKQIEFSDAQAVTATAISTNVYDLFTSAEGGSTAEFSPNTRIDVGLGTDFWVVVNTQTLVTDSGSDATLVVTIETADDAAVYKLNDSQALVATTDFFMPIVDDPFEFGRIAATNAISDVYAMGAQPIMALALVGMPVFRITCRASSVGRSPRPSREPTKPAFASLMPCRLVAKSRHGLTGLSPDRPALTRLDTNSCFPARLLTAQGRAWLSVAKPNGFMAR